MSWNYRVIEFTEPDGKKVRAIHEVFYTDYPEGGRMLTSYSENPAVVLDDSDDPTVMFKILIKMSKALLFDVVPADELEKKEDAMKLEGWIATEDNCLWVACQSKTVLVNILDSFEDDSGNPFRGKIETITITIPEEEK